MRKLLEEKDHDIPVELADDNHEHGYEGRPCNHWEIFVKSFDFISVRIITLKPYLRSRTSAGWRRG